MENEYFIEHRIKTLLWFSRYDGETTFLLENFTFSRWENKTNQYWKVYGTVRAESGLEAINEMRKKIQKISSRIAFVGQAFIDHINEPFLVQKIKPSDENVLFYYVKSIDPIPLGLLDSQINAIGCLTKEEEISEEFFVYWKDAINAIGHSAKIILMICAIEALSKFFYKSKKFGNDVSDQTDKIIGKELREKIWGGNEALRNRIMHGEYFPKGDETDYFSELHTKVVNFINSEFLKGKDLVENAIKNPQRHFFGNFEYELLFLKKKRGMKIELENVISEFYENRDNLETCSIIDDSEEIKRLQRSF